MKRKLTLTMVFAFTFLLSTVAFGAYHHEGENDAANFLIAYPDKENKLP